MAKEFKQWDKAFSKAEINACRKRYLNQHTDYTHCPIDYVHIHYSDARYAVYEAEGFRDWQLFRVAMKGISTQGKLSMMWFYWITHQDDINKIRIWNYIGALKRGGQLDDNLKVVK